jgi:kynurenine formamidase
MEKSPAGSFRMEPAPIRSLETTTMTTRMSGTAAVVVAAVAALATVQTRPTFDPADYRIIDLTHAYGPTTVFWPTAPTTFTLTREAYGTTPGGFFYAANSFCLPEHGGTHLDAPVHFGEGKRTAEQIPLEQLVARTVVIDVTAAAAADRHYRLTADDVARFEARHGRIAAGTIVLLRTGWSRHWPNAKAYLGDDTRGDASKLSFPSFGVDAARLLVSDRNVAALGIDTASIDYGQSTDFQVHRLAAAANVPGFENLTNLDQLPPTGAILAALPMKIEGGSGGPLRAISFVRR